MAMEELWLWLAIAAGLLSIVYGVIQIRSILAAPAGNERMQEIAKAATGLSGRFNQLRPR